MCICIHIIIMIYLDIYTYWLIWLLYHLFRASRYLATFGFAPSPVTPPRLALVAGKSGSSKMPWRDFFFGIPLKSTNSGSAGMISGGGKTRFWCMRFSCATTTSRSNSSALLQAVPMRATAGPEQCTGSRCQCGQTVWCCGNSANSMMAEMTEMTLRATVITEHWSGKNSMNCPWASECSIILTYAGLIVLWEGNLKIPKLLNRQTLVEEVWRCPFGSAQQQQRKAQQQQRKEIFLL